MDINLSFLPAQEQLPLRLRLLYEKFGYARFRMGKFEPYDIYMENRSFLKSENIITFTNAQGRLMALKPDVTLSIVKNALPDSGVQKYYYNENVFRIEHSGEEYREISQMGIEYLGSDSGYDEAEVVSLALDSLALIDDRNVLDVSHMGFISGLLSAVGLSGEDAETMLGKLRQKNADEISQLCENFGIFGAGEKALVAASRLRMPLCEAICQARELVLCKEMAEALDELEALGRVLSAMGKADHLYLDFSLINDMDYYNGLVFRGYVRVAKRAVLAGGRYDNLMRRFGKNQSAVGFAVYLSELDRVLHERPEYDVDVLLIYGNSDPTRTAEEVCRLSETCSVRAERVMPKNVRARKVVVLDEEAKENA